MKLEQIKASIISDERKCWYYRLFTTFNGDLLPPVIAKEIR